MSDKRPDLPYEKAAEETAKSIGKGLDLVNRAAPAIGDAYGFLIGDRIKEQRVRNADKMARETKRILDERKLKETSALPEDLATPLLEAAQREPRDEILRLYSALAANAMDPNHDDIRPEYVETVRRWQPIELRIMRFGADRRGTDRPFFSIDDVLNAAGDLRRSAIDTSLDHLIELKCVRRDLRSGYILTSYGIEIMRAVSTQT
ncbi:hypothetical protein ACQR09_01590 [Bradyrhizobium oligotrophicum]|uniref:Abi-alpha family protein n=1 Tax=Bradyrhizobium oligotrophicum TaxID=44255 RepID=UPI003EB6CC86